MGDWILISACLIIGYVLGRVRPIQQCRQFDSQLQRSADARGREHRL